MGRRWVVANAYLPSERATRADCALGKPEEVVREVSSAAAPGAVSVREEMETGSGMLVVVVTEKPLTGCCKEL